MQSGPSRSAFSRLVAALGFKPLGRDKTERKNALLNLAGDTDAMAIGARVGERSPDGYGPAQECRAPARPVRVECKDCGGELRHIDPGCRMQLFPAEAPVQTRHDETTFYLCSLGCAARFESDPEAHGPEVLE